MSVSRLVSPALRSGLMVAIGLGLLIAAVAFAGAGQAAEAAFFGGAGLAAGALTATTRYSLAPS